MRIVKRAFLLGLIVLFSGWALISQAVTLYKWVDADGKITYQDQRPPAGQEFEEKSINDTGANVNQSHSLSLSKAARENPIRLYTVPNCDSCELAQNYLERNAVPFTVLNVENDAAVQSELKALTNSLRVPVVMVGKAVINGFNRYQLEDALKSGGYPLAKPSSLAQ